MDDTQITKKDRFLKSLVYYEFVNIWFYLYIPWFFPLVLVALLARCPEGEDRGPAVADQIRVEPRRAVPSGAST